ncbi:MAG: hypothetical protein IJN47_03115, partial [Clostridia bacterium]|nr:hypothetical protein [Clostridia bacterium]
TLPQTGGYGCSHAKAEAKVFAYGVPHGYAGLDGCPCPHGYADADGYAGADSFAHGAARLCPNAYAPSRAHRGEGIHFAASTEPK